MVSGIAGIQITRLGTGCPECSPEVHAAAVKGGGVVGHRCIACLPVGPIHIGNISRYLRRNSRTLRQLPISCELHVAGCFVAHICAPYEMQPIRMAGLHVHTNIECLLGINIALPFDAVGIPILILHILPIKCPAIWNRGAAG